MAKLHAAERNKLRSSQFALPKKRAFPVNDPSHAANAKARATQQYNKGNLSASQRDRIHAKANRVLASKGKKQSLRSAA